MVSCLWLTIKWTPFWTLTWWSQKEWPFDIYGGGGRRIGQKKVCFRYFVEKKGCFWPIADKKSCLIWWFLKWNAEKNEYASRVNFCVTEKIIALLKKMLVQNDILWTKKCFIIHTLQHSRKILNNCLPYSTRWRYLRVFFTCVMILKNIHTGQNETFTRIMIC